MPDRIPASAGGAFTKVPWQQGSRWWSDAWAWMFARGHAGVWLGIGIGGLLLVTLVGETVPHIGEIASSIVGFILAGGMATAARKSSAGVVPRFADLFAGYQAHTTPLAIAGLALAVGSVLGVALLVGSLFGAAIGALVAGVGSLDSVIDQIGNAGSAIGGAFGIASLVELAAGLALLLVVSLCSWLSPALIMLGGRDWLVGLRQSYAAGAANAGALTVYGLIFIGAAIVATITIVGWLVLLPLISLSTYAAYRDVFGDR